MFADTEGFFILLIYSLIVGAGLCVFYDALMIAVDLISPVTVKKQRITVLPHNRSEAEKALFPIDKKIKARDTLVFLADITFCTVSALAVIILLYHLNYGEVRVFSLMSAVAGYIVYRKTLGKPVRSLAQKLINLLKRLIRTLLKFLHRTLLLIAKPIKALFVKTATPFIQRSKSKILKRKALKYLLLMEKIGDTRAKKRKKENERN